MAIKPTLEQEQIVLEASRGSNLAISAFAGAAKCLGKGTLVVKADGTLIKVEDIKIGDLLLGVDGTPRTVLATTKGTEEMFKVSQTKGIPFTCNRSHILSVKMAINKNSRYKYKEGFIKAGDIVNLSIDEYLKQSASFRKDSKCYTPNCMALGTTNPTIDAYFVGLWLGDGHSNTCAISKPDKEIKDYLEKFAISVNLPFKESTDTTRCPTYYIGRGSSKGTENGGNTLLKQLGIFNNKHIPNEYKFANVEARLALVAGLLDTDGSLQKNYFVWTSANYSLAQDMAFVCRTLGFKVTFTPFKAHNYPNNTYYKLNIFGKDLDKIPTKLPRKQAKPRQQIKDANRTGFTLESLGIGEYYGFTIDGDSLFLLEDFTVTHNTTTCTLIADKLQRKSLYIAFNKSIAEEAKTKFPSWVECRTLHSLAYATIIAPEKMYKKVSGFFDTKQFVELYGEQLDYLTEDKKLETIFKILDIIKAFCQSDSLEIVEFTCSYLEHDKPSYDFYVPLVLQAWAAVTTKTSTVNMTHDVYLKMYQLSLPNLEDYETIYLDECLTDRHFVKTSAGCVRISSLVRDYNLGKQLPNILSFNRASNSFEMKKMVGALISHNRKVVRVTSEGLNKIDCTPNHPILTQRGYVEAGNLVIGQDYMLLDSAKNQKSKLVLNPDQLQVVLGSYLGDGSLSKQSQFNTYRLRLTQGKAQSNYLKAKATIFQLNNIHLGRSGYTGDLSILNAQTRVFILDNTPYNLLKNLDARGLAIWYMDDGSLSNSNNVALHCNSFGLSETEYLQDILKTNFDLETTLGTPKGYNTLYLNKQNGEKLLKLIAPYMHEELFYKNPFSTGGYKWDNNYLPYGANYISSIVDLGMETVYDITVEDNHNFITTRVNNINSTGCIVHNCQDSNPVTLDIFYNQTNSQLIMVGDSYQSIYEWRGAVNAFDNIPDTFKRLYLTESFRFTPEIAELATKLTSIAGNNKPIIGKAEAKPVKTSAIIVRTNASIIDYLLSAVQDNYKVHVVADLQDLWSKLYHLSALATGAKPKFPNADLRRFNTIGEFITEAERNSDLKRLHTLSFKMSQGRGTHGNIVAIKGVLAETPEEGKFTIVTIWKSKGLEFDSVELDYDCFHQEDDQSIEDLLYKGQVVEYLYVAITRARYSLTLPEPIQYIIENSAQYKRLTAHK